MELHAFIRFNFTWQSSLINWLFNGENLVKHISAKFAEIFRLGYYSGIRAGVPANLRVFFS